MCMSNYVYTYCYITICNICIIFSITQIYYEVGKPGSARPCAWRRCSGRRPGRLSSSIVIVNIIILSLSLSLYIYIYIYSSLSRSLSLYTYIYIYIYILYTHTHTIYSWHVRVQGLGEDAEPGEDGDDPVPLVLDHADAEENADVEEHEGVHRQHLVGEPELDRRGEEHHADERALRGAGPGGERDAEGLPIRRAGALDDLRAREDAVLPGRALNNCSHF